MSPDPTAQIAAPGSSPHTRPARLEPRSGAPTAGWTRVSAETSSPSLTAPRLSRANGRSIPALHPGDAGGHCSDLLTARFVPDREVEVHVPRIAYRCTPRDRRVQDPGLKPFLKD
jgi:hypothetical protein